MRQIKWMLPVLCLFVSGCQVAIPYKTDSSAPALFGQINESTVDFYFSNLSKIEITPSEITIGEKLAENSIFESFLVSYRVFELKEYAVLNVPKAKGKFPIVILDHGYLPPEKYISGDGTRARDEFTKNDFITISPDYRGHGKSDGSALGKNRFYYPVDVAVLIKSLRNIDKADTNNIFMWGHSMGGNVTIKAAVLSKEKIRAVSLWAPTSLSEQKNFDRYLNSFGESADFKKYLTYKNFWENVSIGDDLDKLDSQIIIHHSVSDPEVAYVWTTEDLIPKLKKYAIPYKFYSYENDGHNFENGSWSTAVKRDIEFFKENLSR